MTVMAEPRVLRFDSIEPEAERQFKQLHPRDRIKIKRRLEQPVQLNRCERMTRNRTIWRVKVGDGLRISCCRTEHGQFCICHVGTHPDADRFADHFKGTLTPVNPKPLKESLIMKSNAVVSMTKTKQPSTHAGPIANPCGWREQMELGIKGLVDDLMTDQLDAICKLASDPINELRDKLDGCTGTVTNLTSRLADLARNMEQSKVEQTHQADQLAKLDQSLRAEAKRQRDEIAQTAAIAIQEHDYRIKALDEKVAGVSSLIGHRLSEAVAGVESQVQRIDVLAGENGRLRQAQEHNDAAAKELATRMEQMWAILTRLCNDLTAVATQHDTITRALAELKIRQEEMAASSWTARWKRLARAIWSLVGKPNKATDGTRAEPIV